MVRVKLDYLVSVILWSYFVSLDLSLRGFHTFVPYHSRKNLSDWPSLAYADSIKCSDGAGTVGNLHEKSFERGPRPQHPNFDSFDDADLSFIAQISKDLITDHILSLT